MSIKTDDEYVKELEELIAAALKRFEGIPVTASVLKEMQMDIRLAVSPWMSNNGLAESVTISQGPLEDQVTADFSFRVDNPLGRRVADLLRGYL